MHSLRQFDLVRTLAEHRNFGRAAAALGVSQPSLTRSLKHLEGRLGVPLFDRAGVTPTIFGEIVLRHGRSVLTCLAELTREIAITKGLETGGLTIALAFYPADVSGIEAAARLCSRHPDLALDLRSMEWSNACEAVLSGEVDVAFADIRAARANPDLVAESVRAGPLTFFCAASHPLARATGVTLADLMTHPWAGPSLPPPLGVSFPRVEGRCGVFNAETGRFHPRIRVESFAAAKQMVRAGGALSAGFPFQIADEVRSGELALLPTEAPFVTLDYGFVTRKGRALSPAADAFMGLAREIEREKREPASQSRRTRTRGAARPEAASGESRPKRGVGAD